MQNYDTKNDFRTGEGTSFHLAGIGGIGMSGLAQMLRASGSEVSGSDRALNNPENKRIFDSLRRQGIKLFEQDGSFIKSVKPDFIIYSTAIENDNPDFAAGAAVTKVHRASALASAMLQGEKQSLIAVTGSCGKTTVSAWAAESLFRAGSDPSFLTGGLVNRFVSSDCAGNYRNGFGGYFVFEADESDKSLTAYSSDYAMILNIGTDHYSKEELVDVFNKFLSNVRVGAVVERDVLEKLDKNITGKLKIKTFSQNEGGNADWNYSDYKTVNGKIEALLNGKFRINLPAPGRHTAANAAAIAALMDLMGYPVGKAVEKLQEFKGVWRRFDFAGKMPSGAKVFDDYAHNVEKIVSCLTAAREITQGGLNILFQPHGYGPLGFMRDELFKALEENLTEKDRFIMLPVFYAGGTSSFKPTSADVIEDFASKGTKKYLCAESRNHAAELLRSSGAGDTVVVMGARDNSLSDFARELAAVPHE
ncbi:MAG: hypothetical protein A2020_12585 [Lentisphaerae bacterium GWF2_45_14]|nr:MAG: hypothetical protein A2020_12585 [Lentisphaerae bacterium GWF2_45_14]